MAISVDAVIQSARWVHPAFDERHTPDTILRDVLTRLQQTLMVQLKRRRVGLISSTESITLPLATFTSGYTFPAYTFVRGGTVLSNSVVMDEAFVIEWEHRQRPPVWPSFYFLQGVLYLAGREQDWTMYDELTVVYVPFPTAAVAGGTLVLPDITENLIVMELSLFMAGRTPKIEGMPEPDLTYFRGQTELARREWHDALAHMESITTWAMD
jgi:hypothetical protein